VIKYFRNLKKGEESMKKNLIVVLLVILLLSACAPEEVESESAESPREKQTREVREKLEQTGLIGRVRLHDLTGEGLYVAPVGGIDRLQVKMSVVDTTDQYIYTDSATYFVFVVDDLVDQPSVEFLVDYDTLFFGWSINPATCHSTVVDSLTPLGLIECAKSAGAYTGIRVRWNSEHERVFQGAYSDTLKNR
jgi:hypothetical protein